MTGFFSKKVLRKIRIAKGFKTLEQLAEAMRVLIPTTSKMTIHHWEVHGKQPSYMYLMALCEVLEVQPQIFYSGAKNGKQSSKNRRKK